MHSRSVPRATLFAALLSLVTSHVLADDFKYTGARDCNRCHEKELMGDQAKVWKEGPHYKAFKTLKSEEAVKIAKEMGLAVSPHEADECLRCHATAHGIAPEKLDKKPLRMRDGVQCESCHGPGSEYRPNEIMSDHAKSVAAGMWEPAKNEKICTGCHNSESPTFKEFDHADRIKKIEHPIPEHVKGRYLELEEAQTKKKKRRRE